jgi:rare lipoprotein A
VSGKRNLLANRKRAGLVAATGALTATAAITTALTVGGGSPVASEAASTTSASPSSDVLAAREAQRADRGIQRQAITPSATPTSKPRATPKPKRKPKSRPSHAVRPAKRHVEAHSHSSSSGGRRCSASFYDEPQATASGEQFDPDALTAAHRSLPLGSRVRVTNVDNGESVVVRINDRGPYAGGRCLDLSRAAFDDISSLSAGVIEVRYEAL